MKDTMKKRSLKRKIAFALALSMICSFSQTIGASAAFSSDNTVVYASADDNGATDTTDSEEDSKLSKIDVSISNQLELGSAFECTVTLRKIIFGEDGSVLEYKDIDAQDILVESKKNSVTSTHFPRIGNGTYIVTVEADGFATFTQEIADVENEFCTLSLTAGFQAGYKYKDGIIVDADGDEQVMKENHPGVLVVGDVNGSGDITDYDEEILVEAIDKRENINNSDLNRDTKTDLTDLQFFAKSYIDGKDNDTTAIIERKISPLLIKLELEEGTKLAEGSDTVDALFSEDNETANVLLELDNDEPLSEENAIGVDIDPSKIDFTKCDGIEIQGNIKEAFLEIVTEEKSDEGEIETNKETHFVSEEVHGYSEGESVVTANLENGKIKIDLGNQIAVKKITLKITAVDAINGNNNLAKISKVEFVNGMENRLSEPELDFPTGLKTTQGNMKITATWTPCVNVTEYEVQVATDPNFSKLVNIPTSILTVPTITLESEHGNFKLIKNYTTYFIRVRSLNGEWKSGWSETITAYPKPTGKPDRPDMVKASGGFQSIKVSWNSDNTNSTQSYKVFYRVRGTQDEYNEVTTSCTSCEITGLKDYTEYEVYVVGHNEHGDGAASNVTSATTTTAKPPVIPKYGVINQDENGVGSAHITSAVITQGKGGEMIGSSKDEEQGTAWGVVDGEASSYYKAPYNSNGLEFTFDKAYEIGSLAITIPYGKPDFFSYTIKFWDGDTVKTVWRLNGADASNISSNGAIYRRITLSNKIRADKIEMSFGSMNNSTPELTISELYFFEYDSTMDEIMGLYKDNLHTVLNEDVNEEMIDKLQAKIDNPDEFGNYRTNKETLNKELGTARKLLNAQKLNPPVKIHKEIANNEPGRNFSGLNAWQPLGVAVGVNEPVTVYVGSPNKKTGESTDLTLLVTQYNAEYGNYNLKEVNLNIGANVINLSEATLLGDNKNLYSDVEVGGSMYVYHRNAPSSDEYSIRVDGGTEIPVLDLYGVTDEDVRKEKAIEYIEKLDEHVKNLEGLHEQNHEASKYMSGNEEIPNSRLNFDYNEKTCIAGASEIMMDSMMYSLPAKQIQAGLGEPSATNETEKIAENEKRAETLLQSMDSMEKMVHLFYQHKGLNANATAQVDKIPNRHLNIRYQRMFQGAFMYAASNHIGIQWSSASGMVNSKSVTADEYGKYQSGSYFGWGIAHEIGHCLNDGNYVVAEITNNYYSMLAQSQDKNEGSRLNYNNIYKKVTSGTKGSADQGTQLGMYWQLHLAYDKGYNYATYESYNDQLANLFYARMDTYSRTPSRAPKSSDPEKAKELSLSGDNDQKLMRLACAAAEKNVLEFFERWGKTPDNTTKEYAAQFPKETRAIMYANESSRVYAMTNNGSSLVNEDGSAVKAIENVSVSVGKTAATANKVTLNISAFEDIIPQNDLFGYEIIRCTTSGGKVLETPVGFAQGTEFTDTVTTINNRTVFYKVALIDQYLNRSEVFTTDMVKIQHDGSLDKTNWSISAKFTVTNDSDSDEHDHPVECDKVVENPAEKALDNDVNTVYAPTVEINNAEIVIDFNQTLTVTGLKYTAGDTTNGNKAIGKYNVYVMTGNEWIKAANGSFDGSKTIYFSNSDKKYISTYDATAVKLEIIEQSETNISIAELDVLGVTGDNVDFRTVDETAEAAFGILSENYKYGTNEEDVIPEGSVVFTGAYKGNPTYNVVILYDGDGNIVGGLDEEKNVKAQQIILADVPDGGKIENVSNGTWIYWIEPDEISGMNWPDKVRVELYRVNNAFTNEGQRMVSDSLFATVKAKNEMDQITMGGNRTFTANSNTEVTTEGGETE